MLTAKASWLVAGVSAGSFVVRVVGCCGWTIEAWAAGTWGDWTTFGGITPEIGWLETT